MSISISTIPANDPITTSILNDVFELIEEFINGDLEASDLQTSTAWVNFLQVVRPNFYGSPSPRAEMVSGDVYHREQFDKGYSFVVANDFVKNPVPIPVLSATIHCPIETEDPNSGSLLALFHANFFCFENYMYPEASNAPLTGTTTETALDDSDVENTRVLAAYYELYVNGVAQTGTKRHLYWNFGNLAAKNHSISAMIQLNSGINDISIRVLPVVDNGDKVAWANGTNEIAFYQIFTQVRNMVIDVMYR